MTGHAERGHHAQRRRGRRRLPRAESREPEGAVPDDRRPPPPRARPLLLGRAHSTTARGCAPFRELFGDERADYAAALQKHYADGPPPDWATRHHQLLRGVAPVGGLGRDLGALPALRARRWKRSRASASAPTRRRCKVTPFTPDVLYRHGRDARRTSSFLAWINAWVVLTAVLNETARSMGQPDIYPFVLNRTGGDQAALHPVRDRGPGDRRRAGGTPAAAGGAAGLTAPGCRAAPELAIIFPLMGT